MKRGAEIPRHRLVDRWYLKDTLRSELLRARESDTPLTVAVLTVDSGRRIAAATLREIGHIVCQHMRKTDITCRYSNREFVVVARELSPEATVERIKKIRGVVRALELRNQILRLAPPIIYSGVASAGRDGSTARELIEAAFRVARQDRLLHHHQRK